MKDVSGRKKVIYLEANDLEKFALHFNKSPDVVKAQNPDSATKSHYFGVIQAFALAHFIVKHPVGKLKLITITNPSLQYGKLCKLPMEYQKERYMRLRVWERFQFQLSGKFSENHVFPGWILPTCFICMIFHR